MNLHKIYRFGTCRYETRRMILYRDGEEVTELQPLHRNLLVHFLEHPKIVISRKILYEVGWGPTNVEKVALNRAISELRQRLGSPGRESRYIRTVDGGGYEFIEEIEVDDDEAEAGIAVADHQPSLDETSTSNPISKNAAKNNAEAEPANDAPLALPIAAPPAQTSRKKLLLSLLTVLLVAVAAFLLIQSRPTLESIEPSQPLSHIGDQPLLLHGQQFRSWLTVRVFFPPDPGKNEMPFGDLPASAITWHGQHTATCLIDFNSRPFPHALQLRHPLGLHSNTLPITVAPLIQAPIVDGIAPAFPQTKNAEQLLLVYGAHFQQGPQVNLKLPDGSQRPLNARLIERTSPGVIKLLLYLGHAGQYELQVTNSNGRSSTPFKFTVTDK